MLPTGLGGDDDKGTMVLASVSYPPPQAPARNAFSTKVTFARCCKMNTQQHTSPKVLMNASVIGETYL